MDWQYIRANAQASYELTLLCSRHLLRGKVFRNESMFLS